MSRLFGAVDSLVPEMLQFARELISIPTVNPPGDCYLPCAELIGTRMREFGFDVRTLAAEGHRDHSSQYPRHNVIATRVGIAPRPLLHFN
jgi:succinyl-diaminopimelate desuccinylase